VYVNIKQRLQLYRHFQLLIFIFSAADGIVEKQHNNYMINYQNYSRLTACYCSANAYMYNKFESIRNKNTNLKFNILSPQEILPIHCIGNVN